VLAGALFRLYEERSEITTSKEKKGDDDEAALRESARFSAYQFMMNCMKKIIMNE
jgi:hypothetical protein